MLLWPALHSRFFIHELAEKLVMAAQTPPSSDYYPAHDAATRREDRIRAGLAGVSCFAGAGVETTMPGVRRTDATRRWGPWDSRLAYIAYLAGDDRRCQAWLDKAIALDPTWIETNLVSGMLANRTGRYAVAVRHLSRVVEEFPSHIQAQYQLALAYQRLGDAEKSKQHLDLYNRLILEHKAQTLGTRQ